MTGYKLMKMIDIDKWPRKDIYRFFKTFNYPHFNLCTALNITNIHNYSKKYDMSLFKMILFLSVKSLNAVEELRSRINGENVIIHDIVHPSFTVINDDNIFNFCTIDYVEPFNDFIKIVDQASEKCKKLKHLAIEYERDDLIYITCIPWISFTNISHPINMSPVDSVPRIAWGKYYKENDMLKLPYSIQAHHALVDGVHIGKFFTIFQDYLDYPEKLF